MADLSHLGGLNPVEQLDLDGTYPVAQDKASTFVLPPKSVYTLRAPDTFPAAAFTRTSKGSLQVQIDPTIAAGPHEGFTVRFVKVSATTWKDKTTGQLVSQVGDYLRACGFKGVIRTEQDIADAIEQTANKVYQAKLDWRAYNKRTGWSLEGMERFPKNEDGTYQSWVIDPSEEGKTDENGNQLRVFANLYLPFRPFVFAD